MLLLTSLVGAVVAHGGSSSGSLVGAVVAHGGSSGGSWWEQW